MTERPILFSGPMLDGLPNSNRELKALIAEREEVAREAASLIAKRETSAIGRELLRKVDDAITDVESLCKELGITRKEVDGQ